MKFNFFGKADKKVDVLEIVQILEGYKFVVDAKGSILVREEYVLKGQRMGRLSITPASESKVAIVDGWGTPLITIELSEVKSFLKDIFSGTYLWGKSLSA